jgi:DnaD/phage-associated family protein
MDECESSSWRQGADQGEDFFMANERFINARNRRRGFTTVLNQMLDDPTISLEAKGLLTILLSNKDDWKIKMKEIISRSKNGRDAHYRVINELINSGYFFRIQIKEKGKFKEIIYVFSDDKEEVKEAVKELEEKGLLPHPENQETVNQKPFPENPDTVFPYPGNQDNNNTKYNNTNLNNTNLGMYVGNGQPQHIEEDQPEEQTNPLQSYVVDRFAGVYKLTGYAKQNLEEFMKKYGELLVAEALERTIKAEKDRPIAYIKGILVKWSAAGVQTLEDIEAYEENFHRQQQKKKEKRKPSSQDKSSRSDLPEMLRMQLEGSQPQEPVDSEERERKVAELKAKVQEMRERFKTPVS